MTTAVFTSWANLYDAALDAIATYYAGDPTVGQFSIKGRLMTYRSIDDLEKMLMLAKKMMAVDAEGDPASMVSYGRYRDGFR
jgi:roadblock/LC7 domain-containing protein